MFDCDADLRLDDRGRNQAPSGNKATSVLIVSHPKLFSPANHDVCGALSEADLLRVRGILARTADKWSLWTLSELAMEGAVRFSRLLERVDGISQKSLTATLRNLERDGLVLRTVVKPKPIHVAYEATPLGVELIQRIDPLWTWVATHHLRFTGPQYDDRAAPLSQAG